MMPLRSCPGRALIAKALETASGSAGVVDGMSGIAVAEIILDQTQIVSFVRKGEAAGMAQRVGVDVRDRRAAAAATR